MQNLPEDKIANSWINPTLSWINTKQSGILQELSEQSGILQELSEQSGILQDLSRTFAGV